jgi:penicillin amidase
VPAVRGRTRLDVARATGFLHGQERFFQMDLARRRAAGELAALVGPAAIGVDRDARVHRFRAIAEAGLAALEPADRALLDAYAGGVNAGLAALEAPPFEYLLLRVEPETWRAEDSLLVVHSMYFTLQNERGAFESSRGLMHDALPAALVAFLTAPGGEWDTPLEADPLPAPQVPGADEVNLRRRAAARQTAPERSLAWLDGAEVHVGSNNWVVAGHRTATGAALLANDMHLAFGVPHIWYRASLEWIDASGEPVRVAGVTLPGTPSVVAGSNGRIAWGFTNADGDWGDLVVLSSPADDPDRYDTPNGPKPFDRFPERIRVKGEADETLEVRWTEWGPVVDEDHRGRRRAYRWTAHQPDAVNLILDRLAETRTLDAAVDLLTRTGMPNQNAVVGDATGGIAWTLTGRIPNRAGCDGALPRSWADGRCRWDGWLRPSDHPRVVNPASGFIATANNRVVSGADLARVGLGPFDIGARERQIVEGLATLTAATPADMLAIQLDDRARFLARWRALLDEVLRSPAGQATARRQEMARLLARGWTGRASVDSPAYYLVRMFRLQVVRLVLAFLTRAAVDADEAFDPLRATNYESPVWKLATERPMHLLDPAFDSWDALLLAAADAAAADVAPDGESLDVRTWGRRNTLSMRHSLSRVIGALGRWLDMPPAELPGDVNMPRVMAPGQGASERFGVSPGREHEGYLHMPGGQSGHPLSPHYRAGHDAWVEGRATPFLPGEPVYELTLFPPDRRPDPAGEPEPVVP